MDVSQLHIELFYAINEWGTRYPALSPAVVFVAEYMVYVLAASMLIYWFTRTSENRMMVIQASFSFAFAEILGKLAGHYVSHPQPFSVLPHVNQLIGHEIDNSFPSDHSILFFSVCVSYWLVRRKGGVLWLLLACCVALSRVWVGVHYPVDVAVGACFGTIAAVVAYQLVPRLTFIKRLLALYEKMEQRFLPQKARANRTDRLRPL